MTTTPITRRTTTTTSTKILRVVLVGLGTVSAFVSINVAFGGLETLGLQGPTKYFQVTDPDAYAIRDSHARFYGGVYLGIAIVLILGAANLHRYRTTLTALFAFIFLGGVARLSQGDLGVTFGADLAMSSIIELVGMPALALWVAAACRAPRDVQLSHTLVESIP